MQVVSLNVAIEVDGKRTNSCCNSWNKTELDRTASNHLFAFPRVAHLSEFVKAEIYDRKKLNLKFTSCSRRGRRSAVVNGLVNFEKLIPQIA